MPGMNAGVLELDHALLARVTQEPGLVELLPTGDRGPRDQREVGKPDLTGGDRLRAPIEPCQLLADTDPVGRRTAAHMASRLEAGDGAVEALLVVLVGLRELGGEEGELDLVLVDAKPAADELLEHLGAGLGCKSPLPTFHAHIIRTFVCQVQLRIELFERKSGPHPAAHAADLPAERGGCLQPPWS